MRKFLFAAALFFAANATAQTQQVNTKTLITKDSFNLDGIWRKTFPGGSQVTGGVVTWVTGLTFAVTSAEYQIKNKVYKSNSGTITLDAAHSTLPRIDVIGLNTSKQIIKITGTPSATPAIPQIDPATQVYLTAVFVGAGSTTPGGVTTTTIYNENTEWSNSGGTFPTVNFAATNSPQNGTVNIDVTGTNATNDASASGGVKFVNGSTAYNYSDYTVLRFYIKLKSAWTANASLQVGLGNGGEPLTAITAANGFNPSLVGTYQNISVPMSQIPKNSSSFVAFYFIVTGNGKGFYLDNIELQGGVGGGTGNGYLTDVYKKFGTDSVFKVVNGVHVFAFLDNGTGGGGGVTNLNGQTGTTQSFATGTTGTTFGISSSGNVHTFNIPDASLSARGFISNSSQSIAGRKDFYNGVAINAGISPALGISTHLWINGDLGSYKHASLRLSSQNSLDSSNGARAYIDLLKGNGADDAGWRFGMNAQTSYNSYDFQINEYQYSPSVNNTRFIIKKYSGNVGIGTNSPTALFHLAAGTTTAAPFKLTTGTALTTPQDGAMEYHGSHLYFTIGSTRYQLDQQGGGGGIAGVTASAPLIATGTTTINISPDTTTAGTGLATLGQLNKKFNDSAFRVVRPVNAGTVKLFETPSSTALQIADLRQGTGIKLAKGADSVIMVRVDTVTTLNAQTASYTLTIADQYNKTVTVSNASANTCTVPPNSSVAFPVGTVINVVQIGAGQTTITAGAGVTINSADAKLKLRVQYSGATLVKTATDTWLLFGDITN